MGIIRTDDWLVDELSQPLKICERLQPYFKSQSPDDIYHQLISFGMYKPSRIAHDNLDRMMKEKTWDQVKRLFNQYKNKWSGPDIPVFIFPIGQSGGLFFRKEEQKKAGVSFPDKMFLFLSVYDDPKEIEALFVHEYHHVCRLRKLNKNMEKYTLLDSIIIEGLAEYAVLKNCGKEYLANWCRRYSAKELSSFWDKFLKRQIEMKKNERAHDELLYGGGRFPHLLGYAVGYYLVDNFYKKHHYSTKLSFSIPASEFIEF